MNTDKKADAHALNKLVASFKYASHTYTLLGTQAQSYLQQGDTQSALRVLQQRTGAVAHFFDLDVLALVLHLDEEVARILCEEMAAHSNRAREVLTHENIDEHLFLMRTSATCGTNRLEILSRQLEMFIPAAEQNALQWAFFRIIDKDIITSSIQREMEENMGPPSLCETMIRLRDTSQAFHNAIIQAQHEYEQGAPQYALNIMRLASKQLHDDICRIRETMESNTSIMGPRILRRIRAALTAVETEMENARTQDTLHAYIAILTLDLFENKDGNVLESLLVDCSKLRESIEPCHVCIKCPHCGGKGNTHCEFPGTHGESCIPPTF